MGNMHARAQQERAMHAEVGRTFVQCDLPGHGIRNDWGPVKAGLSGPIQSNPVLGVLRRYLGCPEGG